VGVVLVYIDLLGKAPHPSALAALAAGRSVASSWGATLYAAIVVHDPAEHGPDSTGKIATGALPDLEPIRAQLARTGADKIVVAVTDAPVAPRWSAIGSAWEGVLEHLRPRLVLFGADAPAAPELGARTAARIGARLLPRARAIHSWAHVVLGDRDGDRVQLGDSGGTVALIGGLPARSMPIDAHDEDVDVVMLALPASADPRIELVGTAPLGLLHATGVVIALDDANAADPVIAAAARKVATVLGARLVGSAAAARARAVTADDVIAERAAALAPALCIVVGEPAIDLAGATRVVQVAPPALAELARLMGASP
jgi:electron transfer flavoprotein alpha subunit